MAEAAADEEPLLLGIDGGGSRCEAVLARAVPGHDPIVLGRGRGGTANPLAAGMAAAGANLRTAVEAAFAAAGTSRHPVTVACLGLAGVGRPAERALVEAWAAEVALAERVVVVTDAELVLSAGEPPWGVALIAGTGSLAIGRSASGATARCGGWGPLMGDEGSGHAIGAAALRAIAWMHDGRGPATELAARITTRFAAADARGLVTALGKPDVSRRTVAGLAADVVAAADAGDAVARTILASAGDDLAAQVIVVADQLGWADGGYPLRLTGGLSVHAPRLRKAILGRLETDGCPPGSVTVIDDPALAAARLASVRLG
jgi:N-acetylmuramic acid 6-phosphate etherase